MNQTKGIEPRLATRIVCGLDLEGRARHAAAVATWLSERLHAELEFVHAFPPRPLLWGKRENMPEWVAGTEAAGRALREVLHDAIGESRGELGLATSPDALRLHIKTGHPAQVLVERAKECDADLIVLGTHAKRGKLDFGSTARGVLSHATRGVWVQPSRPKRVRRLLVPVDLSPDSLHALEHARDLAGVLDAHVTALQAFVPPALGAISDDAEPVGPTYVVDHLLRAERQEFDAAMERFDWRGIPHSARFEQGDPAERVLALQGEHDLIVMGTHGRTGLSAAVLGSVAHSVLRSAHVPVLALRFPRGTYLI